MEKTIKDLKVLVVDDSATMRLIVGNYLKDLGIKSISTAEDGREGLEVLREKGNFDFAFLDWTMPRMTGLQLVKEVRADDKLNKLRIIMVTAEGLKTNIVSAIKAGANDYITKPFTVTQLEKKIRQVIKKTNSAKKPN